MRTFFSLYTHCPHLPGACLGGHGSLSNRSFSQRVWARCRAAAVQAGLRGRRELLGQGRGRAVSGQVLGGHAGGQCAVMVVAEASDVVKSEQEKGQVVRTTQTSLHA